MTSEHVQKDHQYVQRAQNKGKKGSSERLLSNLPANCVNGNSHKTVQDDFSATSGRYQVKPESVHSSPGNAGLLGGCLKGAWHPSEITSPLTLEH